MRKCHLLSQHVVKKRIFRTGTLPAITKVLFGILPFIRKSISAHPGRTAVPRRPVAALPLLPLQEKMLRCCRNNKKKKSFYRPCEPHALGDHAVSSQADTLPTDAAPSTQPFDAKDRVQQSPCSQWTTHAFNSTAHGPPAGAGSIASVLLVGHLPRNSLACKSTAAQSTAVPFTSGGHASKVKPLSAVVWRTSARTD